MAQEGHQFIVVATASTTTITTTTVSPPSSACAVHKTTHQKIHVGSMDNQDPHLDQGCEGLIVVCIGQQCLTVPGEC